VAAMPPGVDQWVLILDAGGKLPFFLLFSLIHSMTQARDNFH
jgi:hypothetical protein